MSTRTNGQTDLTVGNLTALNNFNTLNVSASGNVVASGNVISNSVGANSVITPIINTSSGNLTITASSGLVKFGQNNIGDVKNIILNGILSPSTFDANSVTNCDIGRGNQYTLAKRNLIVGDSNNVNGTIESGIFGYRNNINSYVQCLVVGGNHRGNNGTYTTILGTNANVSAYADWCTIIGDGHILTLPIQGGIAIGQSGNIAHSNSIVITDGHDTTSNTSTATQQLTSSYKYQRFMTTGGNIAFTTGATEQLKIDSTGLAVGGKITSSLNSGEVVKIGASTSPDIPNASPVYISMGNTYYNGTNPYDTSGLKLRLYESGANILGFGISPQTMNYVVNSGSSHKFHVATATPLTVNSAGILTSTISTTGSDLSLNPSGPNINFNSKNIVTAGNITCKTVNADPGATAGPRYYMTSTYQQGISSFGNYYSFVSPNGYAFYKTDMNSSSSARVILEDYFGGLLQVTNGVINNNANATNIYLQTSINGFHSIGFNGYYNGSEVVVNTSKSRFRVVYDSRNAVDSFAIDSRKGVNSAEHIRVDKNVGDYVQFPSGLSSSLYYNSILGSSDYSTTVISARWYVWENTIPWNSRNDLDDTTKRTNVTVRITKTGLSCSILILQGSGYITVSSTVAVLASNQVGAGAVSYNTLVSTYPLFSTTYNPTTTQSVSALYYNGSGASPSKSFACYTISNERLVYIETPRASTIGASMPVAPTQCITYMIA